VFREFSEAVNADRITVQQRAHALLDPTLHQSATQPMRLETVFSERLKLADVRVNKQSRHLRTEVLGRDRFGNGYYAFKFCAGIFVERAGGSLCVPCHNTQVQQPADSSIQNEDNSELVIAKDGASMDTKEVAPESQAEDSNMTSFVQESAIDWKSVSKQELSHMSVLGWQNMKGQLNAAGQVVIGVFSCVEK
jgi:hypothetical protein